MKNILKSSVLLITTLLCVSCGNTQNPNVEDPSSEESLEEIDPNLYKPYFNGYNVDYGLYPQTVVDDNLLIEELNKITKVDSNGWYRYKNDFYVKETANPYNTNSGKFSNGKKIKTGEVYWFKCEPITWRILTNTSNEYYLLSETLLDVHIFNENFTDTQEGNYPNNYKNSDIREWLNNDFYNEAFSINSDFVATTEVDNSASTTDNPSNPYACENTFDKVFLPSYQDYKNSQYGFNSDNDIRANASDYALARYALRSSDGTYSGYWTRSPDSEYSYKAWCCYESSDHSQWVDENNWCVRPAITLAI